MQTHRSQTESVETPKFINNILANTLHEVRTPIQTIIGTLDLLSGTELNDEQAEYLRQIKFSAEVLLGLSNNVLDLSKINSKQFNLESTMFDIHSMLEQVTDLFSIEAFNKGVEIITDIDDDVPQFVIGDQTRVQQIFLNLLKNAVKFTPKGHVFCKLSVDKSDPIEKTKHSKSVILLFEVFDTGIGVSEETKSKLFTPFFQADATISRKFGGTGLGLSICKSLVSVMKGDIGVDSELGKGSRFWFSLPMRLPSANQGGFLQAAQNALDLKNGKTTVETEVVDLHPAYKILVVDDTELACKSLVNKIKRAGFSYIFSAYSANEALALMEIAENSNDPYSIVFVDMGMKEIDGWHFADLVREKNFVHKPKLYLCVPEGQMGPEAKMKLLNWFDGYLYKPVKQNIVSKILNNLIQNSNNSNSRDNSVHSSEHQPDSVDTRLSVLVAEDYPVNRKLLVTFLEKFGLSVTQAADGNEAVTEIQKNPDIDIIFMDIQMPGKNGIEATDAIRALGWQGIVIACTANNDFSTVEVYERHGFNDTLIKPFKSSNVKEILLKWQDFCISPAESVPEDEDFREQSENKLISVSNGKKNEPSSQLLQDLDEFPVFDVPDFFDTIGNDYDLALKLLESYKIQTEKLIAESENALKICNFDSLRHAGHTLRGSSGSLSIKRLAELGKRMNEFAKVQKIPELTQILNIIKTEFENFKKVYSEQIERDYDDSI